MLSKRLLVILIMAIMLVSTLVKDGEAAGTRKDINMDQKKATAGEEKKVSDVSIHQLDLTLEFHLGTTSDIEIFLCLV